MKVLFLGKEINNVDSYDAEDCLFIPFNQIDIAKYDLTIVYMPLFFKNLSSYSANQSSVITILKDIKIKEILENGSNVVVIDPYFKNISKGRIMEHYLMKHLVRDTFVVKDKEGTDIISNELPTYSELIKEYSHIYEVNDENGKLGLVDTLSLICDYEYLDYRPILLNNEGDILGIKIFKNGSLYILHPPDENFKDYSLLINILKKEIV
ncbi:hypothetical protein ACPB8Q_02620 [Methanocaldococcus indicus]|uniref:hypothetical protein n=1 Tax=Methanocaldococcus indicus TaxID=213231 RepID=UPI003C6D8DB3